VEELVPLVSLLEQYAVSSAATISDDGLAQLRGANAALAAAIDAGDVMASVEADTRFHDTLVELAANRSLERALGDARIRIRLLRPQVIRLDDALKSVGDHEEIVELLELGDREGAARAVDENWRRGLDRFRSTRS
jgi:DNA-binding GntR family transcriptional regulator